MDMSLKGPNEVHSVTADADVSIQPVAVMPAPQSEALLPSTSSILTHQVMTDEQLGTLRCQISAYATICQRLVEMHKTIMAQQTAISGLRLGQSNPFDPAMHAVGQKLTSRQRWTPSQTQLQILEKLFEQGNGTPNKQRIKEITTELSQHGQISETNVYNWFQNRRARTKRKQQLGVSNNGESEADTDVDSPPEKKVKMEIDLSHEIFGPGKSETNILSTEGALADTNSTAVLNRAVTAGDNGYGSGSYGGEAVLVNGKAREVPALMMEIKNNIVGVSGLEDSQGQRVSNSGFGVPLKFPYSSERLGNGVMTAATMSSEGILNPSLQQATGIKREGLNSGSLVHTYSQSQFRG